MNIAKQCEYATCDPMALARALAEDDDDDDDETCQGTNSYGSGVEYWDARHAKDHAGAITFDWLYKYKQLGPLLKQYVAPDASVLQLGCGNSPLAIDWAKDGHRGSLRNVDNSTFVIRQMEADAPRQPLTGKLEYPNVSYEVADVRDLGVSAFASGTIDAVLDKATFDCIACNLASDYSADLEDMCAEAYRVLRPGGLYILISLSPPASRLPWLYEEPGLDWSVSVAAFAKRNELETDRCGCGDGEDDAVDILDMLVPVGEEVLVGSDGDWEAKLQVFDDNDQEDDKFTYVYRCRKCVPVCRD